MYIPRIAEKILIKLLESPKVTMLLGARQVGKTTLIEHILKNQDGMIFNLDIEVDKARILAAGNLTIDEAVRSLGIAKLLVIDEAQRLPIIGRIVKGWYDARIPYKIILLGSSSLNLLDQTAESLTGRNEKLFLPPLIFNEIMQLQSWWPPQITKRVLKTNFYAQIQSQLLQQIVYGSYPETFTTGDKNRYLLNLVSDYLLKDILQSGLVKSPDPIKRLLLLLAYQVGSEVSVNELASNLQISRQSVEKYLELLERTFIIFKLSSFSTNQRKEIAKRTKIYFWDTGVRNALLKDFSFLEYRSDIGSLWENWVIAEFAKLNLLLGEPDNLYFWRSRDNSEVDLVIKGSGKFRAYEIKWSKKTAGGKRSFTNRYKVKVETINRDNVVDILTQ